MASPSWRRGRDANADSTISMCWEPSLVLLEAFLDTGRQYAWEVDAAARYTYLSPGYERITGYAPAAALGRCPAAVVVGEDPVALQAVIRSNLSNNTPRFHFRHRMRCKDGTKIWLEVDGARVWDASGKALGARGLARDISDLKSAQDLLMQKEQATQCRLVEHDVCFGSYPEKTEMYDSLSVLGRLAAMIGHELRTPLSTITSSLFFVQEALRGKGLGVERALDRIGRGALRCDRIVQDLLDYARPALVHTAPVDVDKWLEGLLCARSIPENIAVVHQSRCGATVALDAAQLGRCVQHLLDNAFDAVLEKNRGRATWGQGEKVTLTAIVAAGRLEITVTDTGNGIGTGDMDRVFAPLYSTKRHGFGLGLPVARRIAKNHGGDVRLCSTPGKGNMATIWLPAVHNP